MYQGAVVAPCPLGPADPAPFLLPDYNYLKVSRPVKRGQTYEVIVKVMDPFARPRLALSLLFAFSNIRATSCLTSA